MGCLYFHCVHLLLLVLPLLLSSQMSRCSVEGRATLQLVELDKGENGGGMVIEGAMLGSRPPRCAGRCSACGHCEAVQVPVAPQRMRVGRDATTLFARDEYSSNYKPMDWKCKCGDSIFNP